MPGLDFIATLAGGAAAASIVGFAWEAFRGYRSARQRNVAAMVTVKNAEGERVELALDPDDEESVRRFYEAVEAIKHEDRPLAPRLRSEAREPTLTLG